MDHETLLREITAEVNKSKVEILEHIHSFQNRVSRTEVELSWTKRGLIGIIIVLTGLGVHRAQADITAKIKTKTEEVSK